MPSTVIAATHYDADTAVLKVVFLSGMVYEYQGVPAQVYAEMRAARSKGKFLNERIKSNYPFIKIKD
jgi:hypothetical protein